VTRAYSLKQKRNEYLPRRFKQKRNENAPRRFRQKRKCPADSNGNEKKIQHTLIQTETKRETEVTRAYSNRNEYVPRQFKQKRNEYVPRRFKQKRKCPVPIHTETNGKHTVPIFKRKRADGTQHTDHTTPHHHDNSKYQLPRGTEVTRNCDCSSVSWRDCSSAFCDCSSVWPFRDCSSVLDRV